jgi:filamentous hemagglutinin
MDVRSPFNQCLALSLAGIIFLNPIVAAAAELSVDPASPGTSVGHAPNGVPVVNIAGPNGSGLSHNLFTDYNVGSQGLILNNATQATQHTQLGGVILGNPGLQGRAASVILNEVTGGNRSHLGGYTEVAGQAARVIVANPHGITCNGCGFINTPRATLTTGKPVIEGGRLDHFRVEGGDIAVEGAGLNARNVSQFDLITRTAKLNAQLHADHLTVITGRNDVSADSLQAHAHAEDGRDKPQLAIDASALGGMYAGTIRLVGTEQGVGVRLAGDMASTAGDIVINANGGLSLSHTTSVGALTAKAESIDLQGPTFAMGDVDLQAQGDLVVRQTLASAANVSVEGTSVSNQGKVVSGILEDRRIAGKQLTIQAQRLDNQGELNASGHLEITSGSLDNNGRIAAGSAKIEARQTLRNRGQVVTARELDIVAHQAVNHAGTIHAEGDLSLVADTVDNSGKIVGAGNELSITAGTFTNAGELLSDHHLQLQIDGDLKNTGLIAAKGDAVISASNLTQDHGQILSGQDIQLRVRDVLHNLGVLSAARHMQINAAQLNNHGSVGSQGHFLLTANVSNTGLLFSGGDLHVRGEHFSNLEGDLYSVGDFSFSGTRFSNLSGSVETEGNLHINAREFENARTHLALERELVGGSIQWVCGQHCDGDDSFKRGTIYISETWRETAAPNSTQAARLVAGKHLSIDAHTLENRYSLLAANGDMHLAAHRLINQGAASQTGTSSTIIGTPGRIDKALWDQMEFHDLPAFNNAPFDPVRFAELKARSTGEGFSNPGTLTTWREDGRAVYAATLQAGGSLNLQASEYLQNGTLRENTLAQLTGETGHNPNDLELSPDRLSEDLTQPPEFQLPSGEYGLFIPSRNPGSPYLIETNPLFTHLASFLSSQYLLDKIGYNNDEAWRRLGDGYYESRLIRDAVLAKTGQRFLAGLESDEEQFRYLMDNGLSARDSLQLSVGVGLTAQQVAALTHDIVWMEKRQVQGEDVLVPVLYLATVDAHNLRGGSLVQGRDVNLVSGGDIVSVGTLKASQDLTAISDGSLLNGGTISAGDRISLLASDSIRNAMAGEIRGSHIDLTSVSGDILNERTAHARHQGDGTLVTHLDTASRISAGQQLTLNAGRDITNRGDINSAGDASLSAGRDINLIAVTDTQQVRTTENGGHRVTQHSRTEQLGANLNAAGNLSLHAGRDITLLASQANAGKDLTVAAGGNLHLLAAANETDHEVNSKRDGARVHEQTTQVRHVGSQLTAGGTLTASAGQDIVLHASQVRSGKDAYLVAGGQLQLLSANDSDYSLYDYKKKGSFGALKTQRDEVTDLRAVGSQVTTGGNLNLISGGDQLYQGARLESAADIAITSGGAVTFEAVKGLHQESHEKTNNNAFWVSSKGKGSTDETLRQSQLVAGGAIAIKAVDGLKIDIKQVNQQSVTQSIDAMVKADPQLAWLKDAEQRGDVDWRQVREVHDSFKYSHSGLGPASQMIIAIVMSAVIGPMAAAAAGGGVGGAMVGAVATGASTNAGVSVVNNRGNLGAVLKDVTASDAIKGYGISAVTAGLTVGHFDRWTGAHTHTDIGKIVTSGSLGTWSGVGQFAANQALQNGTSVLLNKALGQGGSVSDALKNALFNTLAAASFNLVGDYTKNLLADGSAPKVVIHAMVGGLLAEATGGDFKTGALAAAASEALVGHLDDLVKGNDNLLTMSSQIVGVLAAAAQSDTDAAKLETGSWVAKNATQYNYLSHNQLERAAKQITRCTDASCIEDATRKFIELSLQQDIDAIVSCQADPDSCAARSMEVANTQANLNAIRDIADDASPEARAAVQNLINGNYEFQEMLATATTEHSVGAMVDSLKAKWELSDAQAQDIADNLKIALAVGVGTAAGVVAYRRAVAAGAKGTASGLPSGETKLVDNGTPAADDASFTATSTSGWTSISSDARAVVRDVEYYSGVPMPSNQRTQLADELRQVDHTYVAPRSDYQALQREYNSQRNNLKREWELNTGLIWPKTESGVDFQAHHVIPQQYGGPNQWWNLHPVPGGSAHQGGVHAPASPTTTAFPQNPPRRP